MTQSAGEASKRAPVARRGAVRAQPSLLYERCLDLSYQHVAGFRRARSDVRVPSKRTSRSLDIERTVLASGHDLTRISMAQGLRLFLRLFFARRPMTSPPAGKIQLREAVTCPGWGGAGGSGLAGRRRRTFAYKMHIRRAIGMERAGRNDGPPRTTLYR